MVARIRPAYWREVDFRDHVLSRLDAIEKQIKENPRPVKATGVDENLSLRNLAAREDQLLCFCARERSGHTPSMSCFQYD